MEAPTAHQLIERVVQPLRRKQKTIVIEPTPAEVALQAMLDEARAGHVIRGQFHDGHRHCTLGLIEVITGVMSE